MNKPKISNIYNKTPVNPNNMTVNYCNKIPINSRNKIPVNSCNKIPVNPCNNQQSNNSNNNNNVTEISFGDNYKMIRSIGKGSFGEVYLVADKEGALYACKTEINDSNKARNRLKGEYYIYKRFVAKKIKCVPIIHKFLETTDKKNEKSGYNLLVMQLLGKSLVGIFEECNNSIDVGTVMKLAITIISHLEEIHRIGIIHRDIKPENFMFGVNDHINDLY